MQHHPEFITSVANLLAAPHSKQMIPTIDWRLLQGPIVYREQMDRYAKRDPIFAASLFLKSSSWDLDWMLSWLSQIVINVHKLCTRPMLLMTISQELSYDGRRFQLHDSFRIDVSIIETGHTTRIPQYQMLHDPNRPRPRNTLPSHSTPASTGHTSSSNNQHLVPAQKKISLPKFGPPPPPVLSCPDTNREVAKMNPTRGHTATIHLRAIHASGTNRYIPKPASGPSYLPCPHSPLPGGPAFGLSAQEGLSSTLTGQLAEALKSQAAVLERQSLLVERFGNNSTRKRR